MSDVISFIKRRPIEQLIDENKKRAEKKKKKEKIADRYAQPKKVLELKHAKAYVKKRLPHISDEEINGLSQAEIELFCEQARRYFFRKVCARTLLAFGLLAGIPMAVGAMVISVRYGNSNLTITAVLFMLGFLWFSFTIFVFPAFYSYILMPALHYYRTGCLENHWVGYQVG